MSYEMEEQLEAIEVSLLDSIKHFISNIESQNGAVADRNSSINTKIKLSSINLSQFSSRYTEWMNFKQQFTTLIDNNDLLSDSQKFTFSQP